MIAAYVLRGCGADDEAEAAGEKKIEHFVCVLSELPAALEWRGEGDKAALEALQCRVALVSSESLSVVSGTEQFLAAGPVQQTVRLLLISYQDYRM